jgi:DNA (cytosine-5)-methyltransferase 1
MKEFFFFPPKIIKQISTFDALSDLPSPKNQDIQKYLTEPLNFYQKNIRKGSKNIINHEPTNHSAQTIEVISKIPDGGSCSTPIHSPCGERIRA